MRRNNNLILNNYEPSIFTYLYENVNTTLPTEEGNEKINIGINPGEEEKSGERFKNENKFNDLQIKKQIEINIEKNIK